MVRIELKEIVSNHDNRRKALNAAERRNKKTNPKYPYYGANGIVDFIDEYIFDEELLCVAEDGGNWGYKQNCSYIVNGKYWVNNHVHVLKPKKNVEIKYLMYYLNYTDLTSYITGTTRGKLTRTALDKIQINFPELEIQREIVIILDKINALIEKNKKRIIYLEELVKSRFIEMFGDPIKNDKGWEVKKLGEITNKIGDGLHGTPKYDINGSIPFINGNNLTEGKIVIQENTKFVNKVEYKKYFKEISINTVFLSINGTLGRLAFYNNERIVLGKSVCFIDLKKDINKIFIYYLLKNKKVIYELEQNSTKSTIKNISLKYVRNFNTILPPCSLQNIFAEFVTRIDKLKFLYNFIWYIFTDLLKKLIKEVLFFLTFLIISANIRLDIELAEKEKKMKYYRRSIEQVINEYKEQFPILLLTGPRQVGKSTLFKELFQAEYKYFSLDDPILKEQIVNDPRLFLKNNPEKLIIDEVQYAPSIFPYLKMKVDENREDGMYLMTGSQAFVLMKNVSETLAGRVGILELQGISLREQFDIEFNRPFIPNEEYIAEREKKITEYTNLWQRIHRGYMPELIFNDRKKWEFFYSSYVQTYIERDVRDLINISDESKFLKFMISLASRSGELLNYGAVANEVGISNETVKRWVSVLRTSRIIYLLEPYFNNHLKRVIKTPKIYFMDVGLLAYLTKWPTPETLANGAKAGNIFETFIISEIVKSYLNAGIINPPLYFYRDKDKKEIDLIIEESEKIYPIEIKMSASPNKEMAKNFSVLKRKIDKEIGTGIIICQYDNKVYLSEDILVLPIEYI
ncbi:type I restriction modification DNA specificity domain protein [Leptotrichia trevisanii]|uniref:Type I restriction modification DNA specificity domain protein n=1 Tax=Leptotrichia trevisanii TaxID=109328 RepID=A0A510KKQ3_9FUSO|nr:restriction endonuclease subunit S [Leptotrichia trevisanii]BBM51827.1 type I restriction modification DNA specificity domain protein [Leptotrichia trevisanii]